MKTVVISIATPGVGDLLVINACPPGGGKTSAKHHVIDGDTPRSVAASLAREITQAFMAECIQARAKENGDLILSCTDFYDKVAIITEVQGEDGGEGGTALTITEF